MDFYGVALYSPRSMSQMLKSSGAMGIATIASRILGLVREQVYAGFMGAGAVTGAFMFAFAIPNLFRRLLGEGALTAAFIPIFKAKEKTEGEAEMWRSANAVVSGLIVAGTAITALVMIGVTIALNGFTIQPKHILVLELVRVMFPYMVLVCFAAACMGMLNARGHFFIPALGGAMLNVVMISAVLFVAPHWGEGLENQVFALAYGVVVAGFAQASFQMPVLFKEGFRFRWVTPWRDETVREVVRKMLPASIGVAAFQINVLLTQVLAYGTHEAIVAQFAFAVRLMELPQGVFGISLGTFLLPTLAGLAAEKNYKEFRSTLDQGISYLFLVNLLASILLFVLAEPIIRLLFEHGKFSPEDTSKVSFGLLCLAPGLLAFSLVNIMARAFYALGDVKVPMRISIFCLAVNLMLAAFLLLGFDLGVGALGIANTLTSTLNLALLLFALRKKLKTLEFNRFRAQIGKLLAAGGVAAAVTWIVLRQWNRSIGHETLPQQMGEVFVPMICTTVAYFLAAWALRVPSAGDLLGLVTRRLRR